MLGSWAAPAAADPPETWEESSAGGGELFLILGGLALAVIAVIALLTYLPSMMRHNQTTEPALAFRERSEWFGGPRQGLEDAAEPGTSGETRDSARGGGSAHW